MKTAIILFVAVAIYLKFLQIEHDIAVAQLARLEQLYTRADAEARAIDTSNR